MDELFPLVDELGNTIGSATRRECHRDNRLLHPVVHVLIYNTEGALLLQKRSMNKDIQPGKWDTSVGGHMALKEDPERAAHRETWEELGIQLPDMKRAWTYIWRSERESEWVCTFTALYEGPVRPCPDELEEARFWSLDEIERHLEQNLFTPNFELEFSRYRQSLNANH